VLVGSLAFGADAKQLAAKLGSGSAADQRAAADELADMGAAAQVAVPQLVAALSSNDADLRWRAARALGLIGDLHVEESLRKAAIVHSSFVPKRFLPSPDSRPTIPSR